jgi:hypothetical protein
VFGCGDTKCSEILDQLLALLICLPSRCILDAVSDSCVVGVPALVVFILCHIYFSAHIYLPSSFSLFSPHN